ncbi:hypothetical protein QWY90_08990 [Flavobacterium paronense]|uniref:Uncharacterized protein n=1 Tax=Flavobacterium paronense TaxID=1392775 RepID=A0ABV5GAI7_9FLAO|nr:hypothetical protein [Flavobacterium paronense]MDN3677453.1 hypothetical protein [Flavobacterium paronense]
MRIVIKVSMYCLFLVLTPFMLQSQVKSKAGVRTMIPIKSEVTKDVTNECCSGSYFISQTYCWDYTKVTQQNKRIIASGNSIAIKGSGQLSEALKGCKEFNKETCGETITQSVGSILSFSGNFYCNSGKEGCQSRVVIKIKTPTGAWTILSGTYSFDELGLYEIKYEGYCDNKTEEPCKTCSHYISVNELPKDCCSGSGWEGASYQLVAGSEANIIYGAIQPFTTVPPSGGNLTPNSLSAELAVNIENLKYRCADATCAKQFFIKRINLDNPSMIIANDTLPLNQVSTSIYDQSYKQKVFVYAMCGGKVCGVPLILTTESNKKNVGAGKGGGENNPCDNCDAIKNLVINGDFENWNNGLGYVSFFTPSFSNPGYVNDDKFFVGSLGNSKCLEIQAKNDGMGNGIILTGRSLWRGVPITVEKDKKYHFCFEMLTYFQDTYERDSYGNNLAGNPSIIIDVYINGQLIINRAIVGGIYTYNYNSKQYQSSGWVKKDAIWTSNSTTANIEIKIRDWQNRWTRLWKFGIDDIVFKECQ